MGNFFVRITIVLVTIYFLVAYLVAQFVGIDILYNSYVLLFELCVVVFTFSSGRYHCKFMKWTALSIFVSDLVSHADYYFNFIPLNMWSCLPLFIIALGVGTSATLAIRHFIRVNKIKKQRYEQSISNEKNSTITY